MVDCIDYLLNWVASTNGQSKLNWISFKFHYLVIYTSFLIYFPKFSFATFRLNMDVTWSETGDRYMLKLFRDYLFHSVTDDGTPWLDHAHIVQCLNKLDAGTLEKVSIHPVIAQLWPNVRNKSFTCRFRFLLQVQLMSRDEQSILIVTYEELKHCLDQAFCELTANSVSLT